jgi:exonuclease SbcC
VRILAIRGENLASLAREFEVELGDGPLAASGVFAIVGPTGAGKSTLLDAICVALFDRTPRLGGRSTVLIGRGDDVVKLGAHDVRTILRRGASRGWAEVDFEGVDGKRYRSRWEVWRAQRGASGRLQDQRITLTCVDTGERLGGTRTETLDAIRARLGLKFEQFCRSALLAQGEFAAFLRADAADRADLLERMTGTEIYGDLSILAHKRASEVEGRLRERRAALGQINVLADDERAAVVAGQREATVQLGLARARRDRLAARAAWATQRRARVDAIAAAEVERAAAAREWTAAADLRERIERAQRAEQARPAWDERARAVAATRDAAVAVKTAEQTIQKVGAGRDRAIAERATLDEIVARARGVRVDAGLPPPEPGTGRVPGRGFEAARVGAELARLAGSVATLDERRRAAAEDITLARAQLQVAEHDAARFTTARAKSPIAAVRRAHESAGREVTATRALVAVCEQARIAAGDEASAASAHAERVAAGERHRAEMARAAEAAAKAKAALGEARRTLDRLAAAASLEHHRSQLADGEACPLCGATEHPWAGRGAVDELVDEQQARVDELNGAILAALAAGDASKHAIGATEAALAALDTRLAEAVKRRRSAAATFREALAALGELPWSDDPADPSAQRVAVERAAIAERGFEKARAALAVAEAAEQAATDANTAVIARTADLRHAEDRVRGIDDDATKIVAALRTLEADLIATRDAADVAVQTREREVAAATAGATAARAEAERAAVRVAQAEAALGAAARVADLTAAELADAMARPPGWIDGARRDLDAIAAKRARADAIVDERTRQLAAHDEARPALEETDADPGVDGALLVAAVDAASAEAIRLERAVAIAGERLRADDAARERRRAATVELDGAEAAAGVDRALADLIGSHDGKAFRTFAQSLTLDALLVVANDHLLQLAPRYQLERVPGHDLELQIVDRDLGDEVRSVSSLSGGESFLVSLALALALSSVSARNVRVRTLLIDEGFGTLDPGSLDTALSVLDALQQTGCQVGIISHVAGLIERVGAHVVVRPLGGGRSAVEIRAA